LTTCCSRTFWSALDPFGNTLDVHGVPHDSSDRPLDPLRCVLVDGAVARDEARDAECTRALAARLLAAYRCDSVALPSGVLAFALFNCLCRRHQRLDLFRLLRVFSAVTRSR
jgi:hypothetical protein